MDMPDYVSNSVIGLVSVVVVVVVVVLIVLWSKPKKRNNDVDRANSESEIRHRGD